MSASTYSWFETYILSQWQIILTIFILMVLLTLIAALALIFLLPRRHFLHSETKLRVSESYLESRSLLILSKFVKNLMGIVLLILGIIMLFLPGQGLLTILLALLLIDFPRKHQMVDVILSKSQVRQGLNRLRTWMGRPPFEFKDD